MSSRREGGTALAHSDDRRTVVWVRGEHDISTVPGLARTMAGAMALDDPCLVVDLSGVQFMDASTVGLIIRYRGYVRRQSRSFVVRAPSRTAQRVLDLCGLGDLVDPGPAPAGPRLTLVRHGACAPPARRVGATT